MRLSSLVSRALRRVVATTREPDRSTSRPRRRSDPPTRAVPPGVVITYAPSLDGDPDPGEVVWTWVPYEDDPKVGKDRPVVVVGRRGRHLAAVALTSKAHAGPGQVVVGPGPWDPKGRPSYAKVDRLLDVVPGAMRREGAVLDRDRFDAVVAGVGRFHRVERG